MFILSLYTFHSQKCQMLGKFWNETFYNEQNIFEVLFHHKMLTILFSTITKTSAATSFTSNWANHNWAKPTIKTHSQFFFSFLHLNNLKSIINQRDLSFFKCGGVWRYQLQDSWFTTNHESPSLVVGHACAHSSPKPPNSTLQLSSLVVYVVESPSPI